MRYEVHNTGAERAEVIDTRAATPNERIVCACHYHNAKRIAQAMNAQEEIASAAAR